MLMQLIKKIKNQNGKELWLETLKLNVMDGLLSKAQKQPMTNMIEPIKNILTRTVK